MADFPSLEKRIISHPQYCKSVGPATEEQVAETERLLGLPLPAEFRAFLRRHRLFRFFGCEVLGIPPLGHGGHPSLVFHAKRLRREIQFPHDCIPFMSDNGSIAFIRGSTSIGPVYEWDTHYTFDEGRCLIHNHTIPSFLQLIFEEQLRLEEEDRQGGPATVVRNRPSCPCLKLINNPLP